MHKILQEEYNKIQFVNIILYYIIFQEINNFTLH